MVVPAFIKTAFVFASVLGLAACGGGGGNGVVPASTPAFNAPLSSMNEPVTFNAIRSQLRVPCIRCSPSSSASERSTDYQIKIDPNAQTVEIFENGISEALFTGIDYTNGNEEFDIAFNRISTATTQDLKILLPGASASNLDYASYGVWTQSFDPGDPGGLQTIDAEALSFGVPTTGKDMPTTGTATYSGFMDGYYANAASDIWNLTGSTTLTADFVAAEIAGEVNNISARHITGSLGTSNFGNIVIDGAISGDTFSGRASSDGLSGIPGNTALSGSTLGQFYGPNADEVGGVIRMSSGSGGEAVGAFAAGK